MEWFVRKQGVHTEKRGTFVMGRRNVGVNLRGRTTRSLFVVIGVLLVGRVKLNSTRNRPRASLEGVSSHRERFK